MPSQITVFSRFPELAALLPYAVEKIIKKSAFDVMARAATTAPIKTGFLRSSIYVMGKDYTTYGEHLIGGGKLGAPIEPPEARTSAYVAVGAEYGIYIEYGSRYRPARPFLLPALEFVKPRMEEAFAQLELFWREVGA